MDLKSFKETIEKSSSIVIFSHVNPDGDTLGSMCALYQTIKNHFGKEAVMVTVGKIPDIYHFLPFIRNVKKPEELDLKQVFDLAVAVDIAAKDRMAAALPLFENAKVKMNIDHHKTNNGYGDINFVRADASCAGEVLLDIFEELSLTPDKNTAISLYTAVLTDTGCFRFENTKSDTLKKAAKLIEYGADAAYVDAVERALGITVTKIPIPGEDIEEALENV